MTSNTSHSEDKKRNRRLAALASVLLLIPLGVFGSLFYLQQKAAMNQYPDRRPWDDPQVAASMRKVRLVQAQALRERYGKWAEQHQDGLKRLLHSKDQEALLAWYQATDPSVPGGPISDHDPDAGKRGYTWDADRSIVRIGKARFRDPGQAAVVERGLRMNFAAVQADYEKFGDYKIARSVSIGPEGAAIWASGRVTVERIMENPVRKRGLPAFVEVPPEEVTPAFNFAR